MLIHNILNKAYNSSLVSVVNSSESNTVQYLLTSKSAFDLSCLGTLKLEKNFIKAAFKYNYCRELLLPNYSTIKSMQVVLPSFNEENVLYSKNTNLVGDKINRQNQLFTESSSTYNNFNTKTQSIEKNFDLGFYNRKTLCFSEKHFLFLSQKKALPLFLLLGPTSQKTFDLSNINLKHVIQYLFKTTVNKNSLKEALKVTEKTFLKSSNIQKLKADNFYNMSFTRNIKNKEWVKAFKSSEFVSGYLKADWVLHTFTVLFNQQKKSPRSIMNQLMNDMRICIEKLGINCPILGIRITITGRLGNRKKAMAQQINKCVGKVPLSTLRQKVDYSQGFLSTRFGLVGIKVWICYA